MNKTVQLALIFSIVPFPWPFPQPFREKRSEISSDMMLTHLAALKLRRGCLIGLKLVTCSDEPYIVHMRDTATGASSVKLCFVCGIQVLIN